ncbi:hypothetical protein HYV30_01860 [Candidatus Kaiserbacteria bacterium]|nr:hypothetical protein [Candidatus Kaiserbacteria bacterium]
MSPEGKSEKKLSDEVITSADELQELIDRIEKDHPKLKGIAEQLRKGRAETRAKGMQPEISLEEMFGPTKAAQMRREGEARDRQTPQDSR